MKIIKEAMNNVPEVEEKLQGVADSVLVKAKEFSDEAEKVAEENGAIKAEDAIKQEPITGHDKKDYPKEVELPKATLDESLFDEVLNEGKEILAVSELVKAAKKLLFVQPQRAREVLERNYSLINDYLESGLSAEDYFNKQLDYYGARKYINWFGAGCPTRNPKNFREELEEEKESPYIGKVIRIIKLDNGDSPIDDSHYNGKMGVVKSVDDLGQLHGTWGGLAVIPGQDEFEVVDNECLRISEDFDYLNCPDCEMPNWNGSPEDLLKHTAYTMRDCGLGDELDDLKEKVEISMDYEDFCKICDTYIQACNQMYDDFDDDFDYESEEIEIDDIVDTPDFYFEVFKFNM